MFTVVLYILRRLVDQDDSKGRQAQNLLELWVGKMKAFELAQLVQEEDNLKASWQPPGSVPVYDVDVLEEIRFRYDNLADSGIDSFLRGWWFHLMLPGNTVVKPVSAQLIDNIGLASVKQATSLCVGFLLEEKPEIVGIDRLATIGCFDALAALIELPRPGAGDVAYTRLCSTFSAWSACGGERGRAAWSYQGLEAVIAPST